MATSPFLLIWKRVEGETPPPQPSGREGRVAMAIPLPLLRKVKSHGHRVGEVEWNPQSQPTLSPSPAPDPASASTPAPTPATLIGSMPSLYELYIGAV